ncbi:unnamed protein product [Durusdinium trenchii]|uniref:Uncharacterized protein n=1 Tax=Durusdinium trenchii TaxID=1381693 RepID=A0ABP0RA46_9DINO
MLDIALQLLHRRRLSESGEILKFAWGDAADKWNLQIYNARYRWMRKSDCVQLGRAWRFLCKHPHTRTMECDVEEKRKEYSSLLFKSIHLHTLVPQLLGNRKTALVDKVSAHVHASLLESSSLDALDESFANHICWCSDMGVESALPSFHVLSAEKVMPAWLQPSRVNVHEPDDDHFEDGVLVNLESANCKSSPLMPQAISVPGICHAIHNATGRLNSAFHGFEDFLGKLKSLYQFLGSPPRCNRFVEVVMRGTLHYERAKELFLRRLTSIYTERWNIVAICLEESLPLLLFLRTHWDDVRFLRNADDDGPSDACMKDGWSPKELTVIVQDSYFLAFWRMQLAIRKQLLHFTSWAEGCSCHGGSLVESFMNEHESEVSFEHVLKAEIVCPAGIPCRCPMAGCQAPFLAADNFSDFERKLDSTCQEFMSNCQERLTSEQWSSLLAEWQHGSKVVLEEVKARLSFFSHLPWIVFGGCHPMPDVARKALAKAKQLWDDLPSNAREAQHPIARNLFDGEQETLTQELASFISSSDQVLEDFPALEAFLAPFTFVQVAERLIEAAHKDLGQTRPKNFSVTWLQALYRDSRMQFATNQEAESIHNQESKKASQSFVPSPAHIPSMQTLVSYRFAQEMSDGGYLLTASAIQRMEFLRSLESPLCLCKVGIGALADLSDLQLFVQMRSKGWEWSLMPVKQQKERVYKIGDCPPESIVLAQELTENPPALIKTDEELDAEVASSAKPLKKLSKGLDKKDSKKGFGPVRQFVNIFITFFLRVWQGFEFRNLFGL